MLSRTFWTNDEDGMHYSNTFANVTHDHIFMNFVMLLPKNLGGKLS